MQKSTDYWTEVFTLNDNINICPGYDDLVRDFFAQRPKEVDGVANASALYYRRWMLRKLFSIFKFDGIPDTWDMDYFLQNIFLPGYVCITDTPIGVIPLQCGYTGINVYNHPTTCVIANPVLGSFERTIGNDCVLLHLQYDYSGVEPMLRRYAYLFASCDSSISVNLMNSKVAFIGEAKTKAQAATLQKMYDQISCGKPSVFANTTDGETTWQLMRVKDTFIADTVQNLKETIKQEFLTEIGIKNSNTQKRERLITAEAERNDDETRINVEHWLYNIRKGLDEANSMFGLSLGVELNREQEPKPGMEGAQNEPD